MELDKLVKQIQESHIKILHYFFPESVFNEGSNLQWYGHYAFFILYTSLLAFFIELLVSHSVGLLAAGVVGAVLQGFYGCRHQQNIAKYYPKAAIVAGFINGVICCLYQTAIYDLSVFLFIVSTIFHILACKAYMCHIEGMFAAIAANKGLFDIIMARYEVRGKDSSKQCCD